MWLFTKYGFYSIVKKKFGNQVKPFQLRARKQKDLENLIRIAMLETKITETLQADYHYRITVDEKELIWILEVLADHLDYENFKSMIAGQADQKDKLSAYHNIWAAMYSFQNQK